MQYDRQQQQQQFQSEYFILLNANKQFKESLGKDVVGDRRLGGLPGKGRDRVVQESQGQ